MSQTTALRPSSVWSNPVTAVPFMATVFFSAVLVFLVQPMFAKMALPILGGSSSVWNVSLVCFQGALLAGYIYAHFLCKLKDLRLQVALHGAALLLSAVVLPLGLSTAFGTPEPSSPALWLIATFAVSIAPPFTVISATAPLIQAWYARSNRPDAHDPYHLYAASNAGSIIGLVAYPLLLEPFSALHFQAMSWSIGYGVLTLGLIFCGLMVALTATKTAPTEKENTKTANALKAAYWPQRAKWLALAFLPSAFLVAVTTHISTDISSGPFVWAPPLIAYIASFIIVFGSKGDKALRFATAALPVVTVCLLVTLTKPSDTLGMLFVTGLNIAVLFAGAIVCHGAMAASRPSTDRLTEFYLIMSLGGVLGGAFCALTAPILFDTIIEHPILLILLLLARPVKSYHFGKKEFTILGVSLAVLIAIFTATKVPSFRENIPFVLVYSLLLIPAALLILQRHHLFMPLLLAAILSITIPVFSQNNASTLAVERGFFGVVKITEQDGYRFMIHGNTIHGSQSLSEDTEKPTSTLYYHENSPIGQVFTAWRHKKRIGAVGLGAGTVACNMGSDQEITFFEIDPLVVKFATNPDYFNFLSACAPNAPIILGDGRLTLQQKPEGYFDVLLLDAFSSDAVPAHLLTREAVRSYFTRVSENGVIMLHISNRHVDLGPILGRIAEAEGLVLRRQQYQPKTIGDEPNFTSGTPSDVVVMARNDDDLAPILQDERWSEVTFTPGRPWTDDYTNIIGAMMEKRSQ